MLTLRCGEALEANERLVRWRTSCVRRTPGCGVSSFTASAGFWVCRRVQV